MALSFPRMTQSPCGYATPSFKTMTPRSSVADDTRQSRWDGILESSVVGSFTSLGYRIRSKQWEPIPKDALDGKTLLITGATSGIGKEIAHQAVGYGARLRFVARNPAKAEALKSDLESTASDADVAFYLADLSSIAEVRAVAAKVLEAEPAIDIFINNAVILPGERTWTSEGLELSHATNLVAPFVLTNALIPRMIESQPSRIINMISGGMYTQGLALDDLNNERGDYRGSVAYARAKRGLMVLTKLWARQLAGTGVTVNATHPGWVDTPGVKDSLPGFYRLTRKLLRDVEQGTDTVMWLATSPDIAAETGKLWHDRAERSEYRLKKTIETEADRARLWDELEGTARSV